MNFFLHIPSSYVKYQLPGIPEAGMYILPNVPISFPTQNCDFPIFFPDIQGSPLWFLEPRTLSHLSGRIYIPESYTGNGRIPWLIQIHIL